jgi:protein-serine/threonine kinase
MTYGGGPWAAARPSDKNYARFKGGWDAWLPKHSDGLITDTAGGAPMCGPLFAPEKLGGPALKRVLLKMLHPNPDKRISVHEVLQTGFVKGIECCSPESYEDEDYAIDASTGKCFTHGKTASKMAVSKAIQRKHTHLPGKPHKTPEIFKHRFDMGDGY